MAYRELSILFASIGPPVGRPLPLGTALSAMLRAALPPRQPPGARLNVRLCAVRVE